MSRCPECDKVLTVDDDLGHDCEVATAANPVYPSNLSLWRNVVNLAEAQLVEERSAKGEVFPVSYADAELARITSEEEIREARREDRQALQSLTNMIVLGNGF
jgi:hypothetical protein